MAISVAIGLKTVFCVLGCVMVATLIYTLSLDGLPFRKDLLTPWMVATLIDFYINVIAIGAWVSYKESNWISASLWVVLLVCFGRDGMEHKRRFSVVTTRIIFTALGFLMLATLLYTLLTDGSPFRTELLTPWMTATLIDFYINVVALSVWVAYKESSWISAFIWIVLLICFGSITTCAYIVRQLFYLSSQDPVCLVLLNGSNR